MDRKSSVTVAIIGSSIAGSALALLFGKKGFKVKIFEQKSKPDISKKACANIVTNSFLKILKKLDIKPEGIVTKKFTVAKFYSQKKSVKIPIEDYEINRKVLLEKIINKAEESGAEFYFNSKFINFERKSGKYNISVESNRNKKKIEGIDYIIAADGAFSSVAKKAGLWQNRKFWLAIQTKVPAGMLKNFRIDKDKYRIFFIPQLGYYSYIFPSKDYLVAGIISSPKGAKEKFDRFVKHIGLKPLKKESALIPMPQKIKIRKGNLFLVGDAACQTKFTGGGIIPALQSAFALTEFIADGSKKGMKELEREIFLHHLISKALMNFKAADFDALFEIANKNNIQLASRDELRNWAIGFVLRNPNLLRFMPKII